MYWGMFNGYFRSLQNTVNNFTRAAGSAQVRSRSQRPQSSRGRGC